MKNTSAVINSVLAAVVALGSLGLANDVLARVRLLIIRRGLSIEMQDLGSRRVRFAA